MRHQLAGFEAKAPEVVFEWRDTETEARGWTVINSLRGGAAGGGTRMRKGLDRREVESLAKTMEIKFTVSGPSIGGAKSGIDFDPTDPRRRGVLERWFKAVTPLLKAYYGTGGDLNVDEMSDVVPITEGHGLWHPQEGIVTGHFDSTDAERVRRVGQLRLGVAKIVEDPRYSPGERTKYSVADLITGWGVAESVRSFYHLHGGSVDGKRVIVQGWGNVGGAAAYYLARQGASIVGIVDRVGGIVAPTGLPFAEVQRLYLSKVGNALDPNGLMSYQDVDSEIWDLPADVFLPCAASRLVTRDHVDRLIAAGLGLVACGANVPFNDDEIFYGPIYRHADENVAVIPDFIANCGMARVFAFLMTGDTEISDEAIFDDVSRTVYDALERCHARSETTTQLAAAAFAIALDDLAS